MRGTIHSYFTPSQARSQNPRHSTISQELFDLALEAERAQRGAEIDVLLAPQTQMAARLVEKDAQLAATLGAYEACFRQLEEMMLRTRFEPEVT
jgi:hypothetical protein